MNLQPTLTHKLVTLRPLLQGDYEELYHVAKDPAIWEQHPARDRYKREVFQIFFEDAIKSQGALVALDTSSQKIIGSTRFKLSQSDHNAVEIGWTFLAKEKWGGTYNGVMKKLMINYALQHVDHVIFYIDKSNIRSQKAVEKIGGRIITEPDLEHLVRKEPNYLTYRIGT